MSELRIMDQIAGDLKMEWNQANEDEVKAAKEAFDKAKKKGHSFFRLTRDGKQGEKLTEFDRYAERIVGVPAVVGG